VATLATDTIAMKPSDYVDLHCHILPGIDDGAQTITQSLDLAEQAVADGIRYILATPHHFDRQYVNGAQLVKQAVVDFQAELDRRSIPLTVFPGQEIHLNEQLLNDDNDLLGIDLNRNYILLELPHEMVPVYLEDIIFDLLSKGITPVIAHPERNAQILAEPQRLYDLITTGCLAQATATSLVGGFGKQVQSTTQELIRCGLIQVIASDAHALAHRGFAMTAAYRELKNMNADYPEVFATNARKLLNGERLDQTAIRTPRKVRKFWQF